MTSHHITSHHITWHHIHITSHHITSHHTTLHPWHARTLVMDLLERGKVDVDCRADINSDSRTRGADATGNVMCSGDKSGKSHRGRGWIGRRKCGTTAANVKGDV